MVLSLLLNVPQQGTDWQRFALHNRLSHDKIISAVASQRSRGLQAYPLDPISFDAFDQWLLWNQQAHIDMDNVIGVQSSDLESLDPNNANQLQAWIYLHWLEHQTAERILGIAS